MKTGKATVHLIDIPTTDIQAIETMVKTYPLMQLRRGDIIENVNKSGYRSVGVYFWDGTKVIDQNYDYDDYGSPPIEFKVLTEFPPDYWSPPLIIDNEYVDGVSKFYWHMDKLPLVMDLKELSQQKSVVSSISVMNDDSEIESLILMDGQEIHLKERNLQRHCMYVQEEEWTDKNGWIFRKIPTY